MLHQKWALYFDFKSFQNIIVYSLTFSLGLSIHFSDCELWNFFFLQPLYYTTIIFYINSFVVVVRVFVFLYFCFIFSAQVATVWIGLMKNCTFIIIIKSWLVYFIFLVLLRKTFFFFFFWFQAIYYDFYYYYLSINKIKAFYLFDDFIFIFLCSLQLGKQFFFWIVAEVLVDLLK